MTERSERVIKDNTDGKGIMAALVLLLQVGEGIRYRQNGDFIYNDLHLMREKSELMWLNEIIA